jgi:hypothetical protein
MCQPFLDTTSPSIKEQPLPNLNDPDTPTDVEIPAHPGAKALVGMSQKSEDGFWPNRV